MLPSSKSMTVQKCRRAKFDPGCEMIKCPSLLSLKFASTYNKLLPVFHCNLEAKKVRVKHANMCLTQ